LLCEILSGMNTLSTQLGMNSRRLFTAMQEQGFFCALPSNPKNLHMECRPLETA